MDLDAAIQHATEKARTCLEPVCAAEHRQLAAWLKELKQYRLAFKGEDGLTLEGMDEILEGNEGIYYPNYADALIGYVERFGTGPLALYNRTRCIQILMENGMTEEEAEEWFGYNTIGAWVGDGTPAFAVFVEVTPAGRATDEGPVVRNPTPTSGTPGNFPA